MSYQALYRTYRPKQFCEVVGQEHITTILKNQVQSGHNAHAYLSVSYTHLDVYKRQAMKSTLTSMQRIVRFPWWPRSSNRCRKTAS